MPMPIFFNQLLISMNLHQHGKSQVFSLFCSTDIVNLKILQSDCSRAFWPIYQEPEFSKYGICATTQQILYNLFIDQIQKKLITQFSYKFKKPCFWPIFPIFGAKKFPRKIRLCHAQLHMGF